MHKNPSRLDLDYSVFKSRRIMRNHQYIKVFNVLQAICTILIYLCFLLQCVTTTIVETSSRLYCASQASNLLARHRKISEEHQNYLPSHTFAEKKKKPFFITSVSLGDKISRDFPSPLFKVLIASAFYDFGSLTLLT